MVFRTLPIVFAVCMYALGDAPDPKTPLDGLQILQRVAQHYSNSGSYDLAEVEERTTTTEHSRTWQETILSAAGTSDGHSRFEGDGESGDAVRVSDGKTTWTFRKTENRYTVRDQSLKVTGQPSVTSMIDFALSRAERLRADLANTARSLKSAELLPGETIKLNDRKVHCDVVRIRETDEKRSSPQYTFEKTFFIDSSRGVILQTTEHAQSYIQSGSAHIPMIEDTTVTFTSSELNAEVPATLFSFKPPPDAKYMESFPDPMKETGVPTLEGEVAPALPLESSTGSSVLLDRFRGHPVLLDIWATWCGPCVAALPQLQTLYKEARDKGLILISIDQDEDANTGSEFLAKKGYDWRNFHDGDGQVEKLLGAAPLPRMILVDSTGRVTYDAIGQHEDDLRNQLVKLGPEFASLAPKPKSSPCAVATH